MTEAPAPVVGLAPEVSIVALWLPDTGVTADPMLKKSRPRVTPPFTMVRVCSEFGRPEVLNKTTSEGGIVVGTLVLIEGPPPLRMYVEFPFGCLLLLICPPHTSRDIPVDERVSQVVKNDSLKCALESKGCATTLSFRYVATSPGEPRPVVLQSWLRGDGSFTAVGLEDCTPIEYHFVFMTVFMGVTSHV